MRVLSFDIGTKNLGFCDISVHEDKTYVVHRLDSFSVIDASINVNETKIEDLVGPFFKFIDENVDNWLTCEGLDKVEKVYIEMQPLGRMGPRNLKTKVLSHILQGPFFKRNVPTFFISPSLKLKGMIEERSYRANKKYSIETTRSMLSTGPKEIYNHFEKHKKKDDLADAFLQGYWASQLDNAPSVVHEVKKRKIAVKKE